MSSLAPALAKTAAQAVPVARTPSPFVQRKCSCGGSAGLSGSCASCDQERRFGVQTKMRVNAPGDRYEHEADALAGEVMRLPATPFVERPAVGPSEDDGAAGAAGLALHRRISPLIQRQEAQEAPLEAEEEDEDKQEVAQMRPDAAWRSLQRRAKSGEEEQDDKDKLVQTRIAGNALAQRQMTPEDDDEALQRRTARRSPGNEPTAASEQAARPATRRDASGAFDPGPAFEAGLTAAQSSGAALEPAARGFMEARFGLDFSRVRIHADGRAAALASAVHAEAFTVGQDVFFAPGRYDPRSTAGRELIAHELVHTVQQDGARPRRGPSGRAAVPAAERATQPQYGTPDSVQRQETFVPRALRERDRRESTLPHREATELVRCVEIMGEEAEPAMCTPAGPMTWADFAGTPPSSPAHSAWTRADIREVTFSPPGGFCRHEVLGEPLDIRHKFQAFLDESASWVLPKWANATNPAQNGCDRQISSCETFFNGQTVAGLRGGTRRLSLPRGCPAAIPYAASAVAHSLEECESVLRPACMTREPLESARLLHHEQGHFDIACKLAEKANVAVAAGGGPDALLRGAKGLLQPTADQYDAATGHGCNATAQSTWDARIAAGLPTINVVPIQQPAARGRRRRRTP